MIASEVDKGLDDHLNQQIPCFAHTLRLVIKDGFKSAAKINKVLSKASSIVAHVRKSHASELLESEKRLQAANAPRWNSQLTMIRYVLHITEDKLQSMDTQYQINAYDRNTLKVLVDTIWECHYVYSRT